MNPIQPPKLVDWHEWAAIIAIVLWIAYALVGMGSSGSKAEREHEASAKVDRPADS